MMYCLTGVCFLQCLLYHNVVTAVHGNVKFPRSTFSNRSNLTRWCGNANTTIPNDALILDCSTKESIYILTGYCATYIKQEDAIQIGNCIYSDFGTFDNLWPYGKLPNEEKAFNESICREFNRTGLLCGDCQDDHYPLAYSFNMNCVECPNGKHNWWKFVLVAFLPLTVFYFVVLLFKISITSSHLHGFVIFNQGLTFPTLARIVFSSNDVKQSPYLKTIVKVIATLYGVWNLDFFRALDLGICLNAHVLQTLSLDLAVGLYPLLLTLLSYLLIRLYDKNFKILVVAWKPFQTFFSLFQRSWDVKTSLIDALVTFFLLTNFKFLSLSFDLLVPVEVYKIYSTGNVTANWKVYYNASMPYFGKEHLPYAVLGSFILLVLVLLPTLVITLYPFGWFQKLLNLLPFRWYILHTFMDSFLGGYKDGTQPGTRDCRWFASVFFIMRLAMMSIGIVTLKNVIFFPLSSILLALLAILLVNFNPYKNSLHTITNTVLILILAVSYLLGTSVDGSTPETKVLLVLLAALNTVLPLIYIIILILHWMYNHRKFGLEFLKMLCNRGAR